MAGWIIGRLKMEAWLEDWVRDMPKTSAHFEDAGATLADRVQGGVAVTLEKVEELRDIMGYGVMSTPGVVINGRVVHAGGVPSRCGLTCQETSRKPQH